MIEDATLSVKAEPATKAPRKKKAKKEAVRAPQRIGIELSDEVTVKVDDFVAKNPKIQRSVVREIARETGRAAAEEALAGDFEELVKKALFG